MASIDGSESASEVFKRQVREAFKATLDSTVLAEHLKVLDKQELDDCGFNEGDFKKVDSSILVALILKRLLVDHPKCQIATLDRKVQLERFLPIIFDDLEIVQELHNSGMVWFPNKNLSLEELLAEWDKLKIP